MKYEKRESGERSDHESEAGDGGPRVSESSAGQGEVAEVASEHDGDEWDEKIATVGEYHRQ